MLRQLLKLPHDPHPWDDLWLAVVVKHPVRDEWWDERDLTPLLERHRHPGLPRLRLGERAAAPAVDLHRVEGVGGQPERADGDARQVRPDLAVGEPARRGARLVRPLAQGPRHRHPRRRRRSATCCPAPTAGAPARPWPPAGDATANWRCAPTARSTSTRASRAHASTWCSAQALGRAKPSAIDPPATADLDQRAARRGPRRRRRHRTAARRVGHRRGHRVDRHPAGRRAGRRRSPT